MKLLAAKGLQLLRFLLDMEILAVKYSLLIVTEYLQQMIKFDLSFLFLALRPVIVGCKQAESPLAGLLDLNFLMTLT